MVSRGITHLTGKTSIQEAWRSLVSTQDILGIKVFSNPGRTSGTRPAVAEAVIQSLLEAGLQATNIVLWDRDLGHLRRSGFVALGERYGIQVASSLDAGYDTNTFYDSSLLGQLVWSDADFGKRVPYAGRRSYVSNLLTKRITKTISLAPLMNHNLAALSGHLFSMALGSVDNNLRFTSDSDRLATAIPEIYALPSVGDKVVLCVTDALMGQFYGEESSFLHYSAFLNQLRFSTDPVALDVLSITELQRLREAAGYPPAKPPMAVFQNAELLQLGYSDKTKIVVDYLK